MYTVKAHSGLNSHLLEVKDLMHSWGLTYELLTSALWEQVWIISTSSSSFQILIPYIINVKRSTKMQPETRKRRESINHGGFTLYFASILQSENKPRVVRFKDLTSSYLLHIAGPPRPFLELCSGWRMEREEAASWGGWWCVPETSCSTQVVVWPLPGTPCSGGHGDCAGAECRLHVRGCLYLDYLRPCPPR